MYKHKEQESRNKSNQDQSWLYLVKEWNIDFELILGRLLKQL